MPPGSIVSLRKRSSRSFMLAGCFSRLIAPSVTSVTPTGLVSTIGRTLGCIFPAGHSPAMAPGVVANEPAMMVARARPCRIVRDVTLDLDMSWSPLQVMRLRMISRLRHDSRGIGAEEEMPVNSRFHSAGLLAVFQYAAAIEPIVQRHFSFR